MVNGEDFIKRLEIILDYYSLNASSFADKIGVQRSSLSHLLSGRNKPSLDFILKIMEVFPEVDLYWMLNGKGIFPKQEIANENYCSPPIPITFTPIEEIKTQKQTETFSKKNQAKEINPDLIINSAPDSIAKTDREIDRIVIFYTNGTFKTYSSD